VEQEALAPVWWATLKMAMKARGQGDPIKGTEIKQQLISSYSAT